MFACTVEIIQPADTQTDGISNPVVIFCIRLLKVPETDEHAFVH